ncbi:hypothetical protein ISN45_At05g027990 [Arabidopsis thaliana x Arabidopsis arenosa]|uniref:Uncharacterized protein n=2 Tax=Arabidopsis TaxID=3701 RepID=A0A8T2DEP1_ARASU|nr:hypothetical protein ISN45_At05g027990 [Arabidopsis thaliana x Arabidopsis arenosa]KAG7610748.1 hypothetical protein ISN44_As05g027820 [Arabidopsis suecica]
MMLRSQTRRIVTKANRVVAAAEQDKTSTLVDCSAELRFIGSSDNSSLWFRHNRVEHLIKNSMTRRMEKQLARRMEKQLARRNGE